MNEIEKTAGERLDNLFDAETRQALRLQVALRRGTPFVEIIDYARSQNIDLIVVGTHGRGAIAHMNDWQRGREDRPQGAVPGTHRAAPRARVRDAVRGRWA